MNLTIPLNHAEAERVTVAARQTGLAPEELIKRLALEHLPTLSESTEDAITAKLRLWQEQDGASLMADAPAQTLFAQWAEEDAKMTDLDREAEDQLWEDIERGLAENRDLQLRLLHA